MTENGTRQRPPEGERGIALPEHLSFASGLPYGIQKWGIEDYRRPTSRDLEELLATDGQAQALENALTLPIGGVTPRIEGDGKEAKLVRENLLGSEYEGGMTTPLSMVIEQMAGAVVLRRAFFEKVYVYEDGNVRLKKLKLLPVSSCFIVPDSKGSYDGFVQRGVQHTLNGSSGIRFKPDKAFTYIFRGNRAPLEGKSAMQSAWHDAQHKQKVRHLNHLHLQMYALGIKVGSTESANEEDQRSLLSRMDKTSGGGSLVMGDGEQMQIMTAGTTNEFTPYLSYVDRQMSVSTLAQWLQLGGSEGTGAQALSRDHSDFFTQAIDNTLREMADTLTKFVIAPLVRYNFGPNAKVPVLKLGPISENDIQVALDIFKTLATAPASRVSDDVYQKIQEKALQSMDIEADEDTDTASASTPAQEPGGSEDGDELERARRIVRESS